MGAAMMRLSNLSLTPALTGLIMVTLLLLGAIVVRVITVSEHREVRTSTVRENSGQVTLNKALEARYLEARHLEARVDYLGYWHRRPEGDRCE